MEVEDLQRLNERLDFYTVDDFQRKKMEDDLPASQVCLLEGK